MKSRIATSSFVLAAALALSASWTLAAEGETKALPTLLIKGEVVSLDTNDPSGTLLKVKDRYGFETPIFLTSDTKVTQGDAATALSSVTPGVAAEVEYNFDVNTAKRHAVSVKIAATPQAPPVAPAASAPVSVDPTAPVPAVDASQAAPSAVESGPGGQSAAPVEAPAKATTAPVQQQTAPVSQ